MEDIVTRIKRWKINDVIRHIKTGHPYLVTHISRYSCTIIDLQSNESPLPSLTILPRDYAEYGSDQELTLKKNGEFIYLPLTL